MLRLKSLKPSIRRRRRGTVPSEALESRTLLSTFYVDGDYQGNDQDGSEEAPFSTIHQGIDAALQAPGDDTVIIQPKDSSPYYEATAITPGYGPYQVRGFDDFNGNLTIRGGGTTSSDVHIHSPYGHGFFIAAPVEVTIENLTITRDGGAGIQNRSQQPVTVDGVHVLDNPQYSGITHMGTDLTVRNSVLQNNFHGIFMGSGGTNLAPKDLTVEDTQTTANRRNGIIVTNSTGQLNFKNVTSTENQRSGLRVLHSVALSVNNSRFANNADRGVFVIQTNGQLTFDDVTASGNTLTGLRVVNSPQAIVSVTGGTYSDNTDNGIALSSIHETVIDGAVVENNGTLDREYYPGGGGIHVQPNSAVPVQISNVVVRGNRNWGNGGGIEIWAPQSGFVANAEISNSTIVDNAVRQSGSGSPNIGGGIAVNGTSNLTLTGSVVAGNAAKWGGGVYFSNQYFRNGMSTALEISDTSIHDNNASYGSGGLHADTSSARILGSTISGNSGRTGGAYIRTNGGQLTNSTVSGNTGNLFGGLLVVTRYGFSIAHTTITSNVGTRNGGLQSSSDRTTLSHSIVAGNHVNNGEDFPSPQSPRDLGGAVRSLGYNIFGTAAGVRISSDHPSGSGPHSMDTAGTGDNPVDPLLGPLQDNGGSTETHLPLPGSPAIDGGNANGPGTPVADQRGILRPQRSTIDIGSVEVVNSAPAVTADSELVIVSEGQNAVQTGSYSDLDGDAVSLSVNTGTIVDNGNGSWSWNTSTDDGPADGDTVVVTATDQFGGSSEVTFVLQVDNVAPEVSIAGPESAVAGTSVDFELTATDVSSADQAADFIYAVDWDSDGVVDVTVSGGAQTTVSHAFDSGGEQTITVTATDKDGGVSAAAQHTVDVSHVVAIETNTSINLNSADKGNKGVQVVIFSTADFDARMVDLSTVQWAGAGVDRSSLKDVDRDGRLDLVLKFRLRETHLVDLYRAALSEDSSENRKNVSVGLTGRTTNGGSLFGDSTVELFMTGRALRDMLNSL